MKRVILSSGNSDMLNKSYLRMMLALTGMMMASSDWTSSRQPVSESQMTPEQRKKVKDAYDAALHRSHGLKEFNIDGIKVWALNRKNAERKIRNLIRPSNEKIKAHQS